MWFDGWRELVDVALGGVAAFAALLVAIRLVGNRAISKMNASDLIITVALGSTFATTMLSSTVTVSAGVTAIAVLLGIQAATMWLSVTYPGLRQRAQGDAVVLLRDGVPQRRVMRRARVSMGELRQAIRQQGYVRLEQVSRVFLEPNGDFSVIPVRS